MPQEVRISIEPSDYGRVETTSPMFNSIMIKEKPKMVAIASTWHSTEEHKKSSEVQTLIFCS